MKNASIFWLLPVIENRAGRKASEWGSHNLDEHPVLRPQSHECGCSVHKLTFVDGFGSQFSELNGVQLSCPRKVGEKRLKEVALGVTVHQYSDDSHVSHPKGYHLVRHVVQEIKIRFPPG
jgi:hypothetical protein